jgi:hypothetical protein
VGGRSGARQVPNGFLFGAQSALLRTAGQGSQLSRPPERRKVEKARECEPKSFSGAVFLAWGLQTNSVLLSSGAAGTPYLTGLGALRSCHPSANSGSGRSCGAGLLSRDIFHRGALCGALRRSMGEWLMHVERCCGVWRTSWQRGSCELRLCRARQVRA